MVVVASNVRGRQVLLDFVVAEAEAALLVINTSRRGNAGTVVGFAEVMDSCKQRVLADLCQLYAIQMIDVLCF